jgi:2-polyprenyl-6-methoxyphenol hydroxylase-like FAD-dependent oxidoreductase
MGQGACQAVEDAVILADEIKSNPADIKKAFLHFEKRRIKRTHYITNTSWKIGKMAQLENEILSSVRNAVFRLLPKSINENQLKKLYEVDF